MTNYSFICKNTCCPQYTDTKKKREEWDIITLPCDNSVDAKRQICPECGNALIRIPSVTMKGVSVPRFTGISGGDDHATKE